MNLSAEQFLAPRYPEETIAAQVDREKATKAQQANQDAAKQVRLSAGNQAPADYDYTAATAAGHNIKPEADGSLTLPLVYNQKRLQAAGYDLTSGERYLDDVADSPTVREGVELLRQSNINTATGASDDSLPGLARLAMGSDDFDHFSASIPSAWSREQVTQAFNAAQRAKIREGFDPERVAAYAGEVTPAEITEEQLVNDPRWLADARAVFAEMAPELLDDAGPQMLWTLSRLNAPTSGGLLAARMAAASEPTKQAMARIYATYSKTPDTLEQFGRGAAMNLVDPINVLTGGVGAKVSSKAVAAGFSKLLTYGAAGAIEGAAFTTLDDFYHQFPAVNAGADYDPVQGVQAAAVGTIAGGTLGAGAAKATDWLANRRSALIPDEAKPIIDQELERPTLPEHVATADQLLKAFTNTPSPDPITAKRGERRTINIQRHHEGAMQGAEALTKAQTADDIARLLDASAEVQGLEKGTQTHAELKAATATQEQALKEFATIYGDSALNPTQLLAARRITATLGEETAAVVKRIADGDTTPELLLRYEELSANFQKMHAYTQGKVTEIARALSQQNIVSATLNSRDLNKMADFLASGQGNSREAIIARATNAARNFQKMDTERAMVASNTPTARDYWSAGFEFWANNILSGPKTHAINATSTPLVMTYENLIVRPVASMLGAVRRTPDRVTAVEQFSRLTASAQGLREASAAFTKTLLSGQTVDADKLETSALQKLLGYHMGATGEKVAGALTGSFRLLGATDTFWKTLTYRTEFHALVARDAVANGMDVAEALARATPESHRAQHLEATAAAARYTFTETDRPGLLGDMQRAARGFTSQHPYLKFIVPFINTPGNLLHYSAENAGPIGLLSKQLRADIAAGGAKRDIAQARLIAGSSMVLSAYAAYDAGLITGNTSGYKAAQTDITGAQQNALVIDGEFYQVDRLDPFAMVVFSTVNAVESVQYAKTEGDATEAFAQAALGLAQHTLDASYMRGMNDFMNVLQGRANIKQYIAGFVPGLIPYSAAIKAANQTINPQPTAPAEGDFAATVEHKLRQTLAPQTLNPARAWDGSVQRPAGGVPVYAMTPLDTVQTVMSPVPVTKLRAPDPATEALLESGVYPSRPGPVVTIMGEEIGMDPQQHDAFVQAVGQRRRQYVEEVINDGRWPDASPDDRREVLRRAVSRGKSDTIKAFFTPETLPAATPGKHQGVRPVPSRRARIDSQPRI